MQIEMYFKNKVALYKKIVIYRKSSKWSGLWQQFIWLLNRIAII